jgi:hypothetical protein
MHVVLSHPQVPKTQYKPSSNFTQTLEPLKARLEHNNIFEELLL